MVKMENIRVNGNLIIVDCYEEGDRDRAHHVEFDKNTLEITNKVENNIYIRQGMWKLYTILREGIELPSKVSSYWC